MRMKHIGQAARSQLKEAHGGTVSDLDLLRVSGSSGAQVRLVWGKPVHAGPG